MLLERLLLVHAVSTGIKHSLDFFPEGIWMWGVCRGGCNMNIFRCQTSLLWRESVVINKVYTRINIPWISLVVKPRIFFFFKMEFLLKHTGTVFPSGQSSWTSRPRELKKMTFNIFFVLFVHFAIPGHTYFFIFIVYYYLFLSVSARNDWIVTDLVVFSSYKHFISFGIWYCQSRMRYPPSINLSQVQ